MSESNQPDPAQWVDRHADALFGYALLQLGDREAAQERVQEAFLAALEARRTYRGESSERTWLIGILKHKICDHFRRRAREPSAEDLAAATEAAGAMFTAEGIWKKGPRRWPGGPEASLDREQFWSVFRDCLSRLSPRMSDAYCLREIHGLKADVICQVLEISPTNLWTLLHRARALLRQCLEHNWFDSPRRGET
ncbi:MAG: sigma-70 family RNA polymerase sigma factor [Planctomycetota bacterium]|jgi:RNA polymerase sigma-70 factor (ECF subfamily)